MSRGHVEQRGAVQDGGTGAAARRGRARPARASGASTRTLVRVWLALLALLALTLGSAYVPLGWLNGAINLAIAAIKALLVLAFFMELRKRSATMRAVAVVSVMTLSILMGLALTDVLVR